MRELLWQVWPVGFIGSLIFLIASIIGYRRKKITKKPLIIASVLTVVFGLPGALMLLLIIALSTGLAGM